METEKSVGAELQGGSQEERRLAASMMGSAKTERKAASSRANGSKGGAYPMTEETRAKLREAQAARREREKQEKIAQGLLPLEPQVKRKRGRPKKMEGISE